MECGRYKDKIESNEIVVDEAMLEGAENGLQSVLDCLPSSTVVRLGVEEISSHIRINRPVTLTSNLSFTKFKCPYKGGRRAPFKIR